MCVYTTIVCNKLNQLTGYGLMVSLECYFSEAVVCHQVALTYHS